jgi:uncharacterized protein YjiS (DUF1127 family)
MEVIVNTSIQGALRAPSLPSPFLLILAGFTAAVRKIGQALKNRHDAVMLAEMDDRMLSDIGLTRSDVRDAYAEPLWRDPTHILAARARERRQNRVHGSVAVLAAPPLVPEPAFRVPNTNRPARYTV